MFIGPSLTLHARHRARQRAISTETLELLLSYGSTMRRLGAETVFFDKAARRRLKSEISEAEFRRLRAHHLNTYAVVGDHARVITVGHRVTRLKRP